MPRANSPRVATPGMPVVPPFAPNPDAPTIYASSMQLIITNFDFMMVLAQAASTAEGIALQQAATIILAPGHAKVLAKILNDKVAEFEVLNGPIALGAQAEQTPNVALG